MASRPHPLAVTDAPPVPNCPPTLLARIEIHNHVVHRVRHFLREHGYVEIPVPELTPATGSCEVVDSMFSMDYFGTLAFPRQTGQLYLEEVVARGIDAVYCEGESLRKERKVDARHLTEQHIGDPDSWHDVQRNLPLLSRKEYYRDLEYGYARGSEPVQYVERVRSYHAILEKRHREEG